MIFRRDPDPTIFLITDTDPNFLIQICSGPDHILNPDPTFFQIQIRILPFSKSAS